MSQIYVTVMAHGLRLGNKVAVRVGEVESNLEAAAACAFSLAEDNSIPVENVRFAYTESLGETPFDYHHLSEFD